MSLLSAMLLPILEKQLIELEPEIMQFMLKQAKFLGAELITWAEDKLKIHETSKIDNIPQ